MIPVEPAGQLTPPIVHVAGFSLRPIQRSDVDDWFAYLSMPHVIEHTSWSLDGPGDLHGLIDSYGSSSPVSPVRFALQDANGRLKGTLGFNPTLLEADARELAYDLHPALWGRGLASAFSGPLVRWAKTSCNYASILATVLDTNLRSARVLDRIGFVVERKLPNYRRVRGEPRDFLLYRDRGQAAQA